MRRRYWVPVQQRSPAYCVAPGHEAELTRLSRTRSLRCRVRRRRNLEFLLQQSGLLGIDPNREDETAVLAHRLRHHLGVTVEPAHSGAVRRIGSYGYSAWPFGLSRDGRRVLVEDRKYERLDRSQRVEIVPYSGGPPMVVERFAGSPTWNG